MRAYLFLFLVLSIPCLHDHALAEEQTSISYVSKSTEDTEINARAARGGLAASAIGLVLSTVGLAVGTSYMFYSFSCSAIGGPGNTCVEDGYAERDRRKKIGAAVIGVSVVGLGTSIFGLVRTKRKLRRPDQKESWAENQPASWR